MAQTRIETAPLVLKPRWHWPALSVGEHGASRASGGNAHIIRIATLRRLTRCPIEHRTKQDYAECLRFLVEERYPEAERIALVQDTLNTHTAGALYETFPQRRPAIVWTGWSSIPRRSMAAG